MDCSDIGVAGPFAQGRGMLELSPAAAAFFVMAFPAHCLVGQMPPARFVGMLSVTRKGLEINSTIVCITTVQCPHRLLKGGLSVLVLCPVNHSDFLLLQLAEFPPFVIQF